jgi:phytoene synthase
MTAVPKGSSFAPAVWLLPAPERAALAALHRFCRATDEAVDDARGGPAAAAARLEIWRAEVHALYGGGSPATAEGRALAPHVRRYGFARSDFERLLDALALDIAGPRLTTVADLEHYCEGVAASPGYLALGIFGCPRAREYARRLGLALQLTNILRDAREDLSRGRVYFPLEDLHAAGVSVAVLTAAALDTAAAPPAVAQLVAAQRARARDWFGDAGRAYRTQSPADRRRLTTARAMERLYRLLLAALERHEALPRRRVRPTALAALAAVARAWAEGGLVGG